VVAAAAADADEGVAGGRLLRVEQGVLGKREEEERGEERRNEKRQGRKKR
jgi:hypothetical protein